MDGKSSSVGPITHEAIIAINVRSYIDQIWFQMANLRKQEGILVMTKLNKYAPTINWDTE